ncbi:MAG: ABC transporter substrate-binding protein, partial [bacterium]
LTVGSAAFPENALLADIYADALSAKGVQVTKKLNIGERGVYIKALNDGGIDFIPEYTGSILTYFDPKTTAKTPDEVFAALEKAVPSKLTVLKFAQAQDSDTITVTKDTASKYNLKTIADLSSVASKLTFGGPAQFKTRADGIPALKSVYNVDFGRFTPLGTTGTIVVQALKGGSIDAADIFSTDPSIAKNGFVSLEDPKSMFAAQNIVPLANKAKVTPQITETVNAVSAKLDTKTLADLVSQVGTGDPDTVAKKWLSDNSLG